MVTRSKASALLFLCLLFSLLASKADGCVCGGTWEGTHPCLLYRQADAVFSGMVVNIGEMTPLNATHNGQPIYTMRDVIVQFSIEEGFRGVNGQAVDLYLTGTSCDFSFQIGDRYFVYAYRDPSTKKLHAGSCGGTKAFEYAARDLEYARAAARGERDPDTFGRVVQQIRSDVSDYVRTVGIPGVKVILESRNYSLAVFTDADGQFEASGLPAGRYKARAELPYNLRVIYRTEREIEVGNGQCTGVAFVATLLGRITGRLIDSQGKPVAETPVNLVPIDDNRKAIVSDIQYQAFTKNDGRYVFDLLSRGRYLVAINPNGQPKSTEAPYRKTYYPNTTDPTQATVISLREGQEVILEDFQLPKRLVETNIEGTVLWADGRPARGAMVHLEFTDQRWREEFKQVDELGHFSLKCYEGFRYFVHAEARQPQLTMHASPVEILVLKETKPVTLVIDQQGPDRSYLPKEPPRDPIPPAKQVPKPERQSHL